MKLKDFLKYFNKGVFVEIYDNNEKQTIYEGKICDISNEILNCKQLDPNDEIDVIVDSDYYSMLTTLEIYVK